MTGLKIHSRIIVPTRIGEREIQLCVGDITRLDVKDKVDLIIISSFSNDYATTKTSVIGALKYNLGVDVRKINLTHIKYDLTKNFHCWITKKLPDHLPYRQLMCFTRVRTQGIPSVMSSIQELFRPMMPLFNNQSKTVITPLLATGLQNIDRGEMVKLMVKTAKNWMELGLPLQTFKIVVFAKNPDSLADREKPCLKVFEVLKKTIEGHKTAWKEPVISAALFLVHSPDDKELADTLKSAFKKEKTVGKVLTASDVKTSEDSWQHDISMAMLSSARIVPMLSQSFLNNEACLDQYNVALCCNRLTSRDILAPVCLERFSVPLYMGTVQWINCKERDITKLKAAAKLLHEDITKKKSTSQGKQYDVFISYCHKNVEMGKSVLNQLKRTNPDLSIFFDYAELQTGVSWQKTLYQALDSSRCVLALISADYIRSQVCQEEFNLALVRHHKKSLGDVLIPIIVEQEKSVIALVKNFPFIDASGNKFDRCIREVTDVVCKWMAEDVRDENIFGPLMEFIDVDVLQERKRKHDFASLYDFNSSDCSFSFKSCKKERSSCDQLSGCDFFISSSLYDQGYVQFVVETLRKKNPGLSISDKIQSSESQISEARCSLIFLSTSYLKSSKEVEELNLIISKERSSKNKNEMYVVLLEKMTSVPTYVQTLSCDTCLTDELWEDFLYDQSKLDGNTFELNTDILSLQKSIEQGFQKKLQHQEIVGLLKVVCDLQNQLSNSSYQSPVKKPEGIFMNIQFTNEVLNDMLTATPDVSKTENDTLQTADDKNTKKNSKYLDHDTQDYKEKYEQDALNSEN